MTHKPFGDSLQENITQDVLKAQTSTGEDLTRSINIAQPENLSTTSSKTEVSRDDGLRSLPIEGPASISGETGSPLDTSRAVSSECRKEEMEKGVHILHMTGNSVQQRVEI